MQPNQTRESVLERVKEGRHMLKMSWGEILIAELLFDIRDRMDAQLTELKVIAANSGQIVVRDIERN